MCGCEGCSVKWITQTFPTEKGVSMAGKEVSGEWKCRVHTELALAVREKIDA